MSERSAEEREAARRAREARRASRSETPDVPDRERDPAEPFDGPPDAVPSEHLDEPAPEPAFEDWAEPAAPAPPSTTREWSAIAGQPEPEPISTGPLPSEPPAPPVPQPRIPPPPPPYEPGAGRPARTAAQRQQPAQRASAPRPSAEPTSRRARRATTSPGGFGDPPPDRRPPRLERGTRRRRPLRIVAALVAVAIVAVAAWFAISLFQPFKGEVHGPVQSVTIPSGYSADRVADLLEQKGIIGSSFFFSLRARLEGKRDQLKAGTFMLSPDSSYASVIDALTHNPPPPPTIKLTIPEGQSRADIAAAAKAAGIKGDYVALSQRAFSGFRPSVYGASKTRRNLEGFLFPATYELDRSDATAESLIGQQLAAFEDNMATVDLRYAKSKNLTAYDVLIIASMIEREASVARDRRLIAAVIYNRLHEHIPLGIDATLRYALDNWTKPLTNAELHSDSAFNTRLHPGLPPTPIGNPGMAAIEAAARPAKVPYLYYVIRPCGHGAHAFSSTKEQFDQDVAAYDSAREKAGGKSPVDC